MKMFGADADAGVTVSREGVRTQGDGELFFVGGADDAVAADAVAHEHDRPDRPMIFAFAVVIARRAAHLALDDDDKTVTDLQLFSATDKVGDAGEELGDEFHLIDIVVRVAVELPDR